MKAQYRAFNDLIYEKTKLTKLNMNICLLLKTTNKTKVENYFWYTKQYSDKQQEQKLIVYILVMFCSEMKLICIKLDSGVELDFRYNSTYIYAKKVSLSKLSKIIRKIIKWF